MSLAERQAALEAARLCHPRPDDVTSALFDGGRPFFFALDKVQVKYEMLRAHHLDGLAVAEAARSHGYSRAGYYLVEAAFAERGAAGLLDERRGRRGPTKLTPEIMAFLAANADTSGAALSAEVAQRFGVTLHRRTIERAR